MSALREEIRFLTASVMTTERDALILFAALVSFYVGVDGYDNLKRTLVFVPFIASVLGTLRAQYIIRSIQTIDTYLQNLESEIVGRNGGWVSYYRSLGAVSKITTTMVIWPIMIASSLFLILTDYGLIESLKSWMVPNP